MKNTKNTDKVRDEQTHTDKYKATTNIFTENTKKHDQRLKLIRTRRRNVDQFCEHWQTETHTKKGKNEVATDTEEEERGKAKRRKRRIRKEQKSKRNGRKDRRVRSECRKEKKGRIQTDVGKEDEKGNSRGKGRIRKIV